MLDAIKEKLDRIAAAQSDWKVHNRRKFPKKAIDREVECDTDKLYHPDLNVTIQYLSEIKAQYPTASLEEKWTGYEDMYMRFTYRDDETDEEYDRRLYFIANTEERERVARDEHRRKEAIRNKIRELQKDL